MKGHPYLYTAGLGGALLCLYLALRRSNSASASCVPMAQAPSSQIGALPRAWCSPMNIVYCANPAAYQPTCAANLTINIACQTASQLANPYMPLFGFVGIAQGTTWGGGL